MRNLFFYQKFKNYLSFKISQPLVLLFSRQRIVHLMLISFFIQTIFNTNRYIIPSIFFQVNTQLCFTFKTKLILLIYRHNINTPLEDFLKIPFNSQIFDLFIEILIYIIIAHRCVNFQKKPFNADTKFLVINTAFCIL